jgi:hypothetical protein
MENEKYFETTYDSSIFTNNKKVAKEISAVAILASANEGENSLANIATIK